MTPIPRAHYRIGDYHVDLVCPSIPCRAHDWQWCGDEYDGPEDDTTPRGHAATFHEALCQIAAVGEEDA